MEGWFNKISQASLGWLILMGNCCLLVNCFITIIRLIKCCFILGTLYILGAIFYALRVPERWFPGKFDLWVCCYCYPLLKISILINYYSSFIFSFNRIKYFMCLLLLPPLFTITELVKWQCIASLLANVHCPIQLLRFN